VTCEGERLPFASGTERVREDRIRYRGAEVWIADRQIGPAQELAQRLSSDGAKAHAIELDVRNYPSFERAVGEAVQQSGRVDYLFNNAGIGVGGEIDSYTLDDWNDVFDVNLRGVVHGIQAVYPIMIRQHSGHIVNTASMARRDLEGAAGGGRAPRHASVGAVSRRGLKFWEPFRPMAPDKFAERSLRAMLRGDAIIVVPGWWKAFWYLEICCVSYGQAHSR
jgi:NAD(P)-dependent dehydrogenase (short-subunit alcohol dehydrogenase family)